MTAALLVGVSAGAGVLLVAGGLAPAAVPLDRALARLHRGPEPLVPAGPVPMPTRAAAALLRRSPAAARVVDPFAAAAASSLVRQARRQAMTESGEPWVNAGGIGIELLVLEGTPDAEVEALNERLLAELEALRQRLGGSSLEWGALRGRAILNSDAPQAMALARTGVG